MDWLALVASTDWLAVFLSVVVSATSSIIVAGIVVLFAKISFDRALNAHTQELTSRMRQSIREDTWRAAVNDQRRHALDQVLSLTLRLRNTALDLVWAAERHGSDQSIRDAIGRLRTYELALVEIMYEERAQLPHSFLRMGHDFKTRTVQLVYGVESLTQKSAANGDGREGLYELATECYRQIDSIYQAMVEAVTTLDRGEKVESKN
jgi:hypothetical protein